MQLGRRCSMISCWNILTFCGVYSVALGGAIASVVLTRGKSDDWIADKFWDVNSLPIASLALVVIQIYSQARDLYGEGAAVEYFFALFVFPIAVLVTDILDIVDVSPCNSPHRIQNCGNSVRMISKACLGFTILAIIASAAMLTYSSYFKGKGIGDKIFFYFNGAY